MIISSIAQTTAAEKPATGDETVLGFDVTKDSEVGCLSRNSKSATHGIVPLSLTTGDTNYPNSVCALRAAVEAGRDTSFPLTTRF